MFTAIFTLGVFTVAFILGVWFGAGFLDEFGKR